MRRRRMLDANTQRMPMATKGAAGPDADTERICCMLTGSERYILHFGGCDQSTIFCQTGVTKCERVMLPTKIIPILSLIFRVHAPLHDFEA